MKINTTLLFLIVPRYVLCTTTYIHERSALCRRGMLTFLYIIRAHTHCMNKRPWKITSYSRYPISYRIEYLEKKSAKTSNIRSNDTIIKQFPTPGGGGAFHCKTLCLPIQDWPSRVFRRANLAADAGANATPIRARQEHRSVVGLRHRSRGLGGR